MSATFPISDPIDRSPRLRRLLLAWYAREGRSLPWRATRDPYRVLVSEVMLQQTQVARVLPAYRAFLLRFGTVDDLAAASPAEVLRHWQGLGYNGRARNLHAAARRIVADHDGSVPRDLATLLALPGVGEYTARAVLAFAFEAPAAPVDTNVARVLARAVHGRRLGRRQAQQLADRLVPCGRAHAWGQSLMELGARHCTAQRPRCHSCPVAAACAWRLRGGPDPAAAPRGARPAAPFAGSNRYHRGRLVDALRSGPVPVDALPAAADFSGDAERLRRIVDGLVVDGLAEWEAAAWTGPLHLPRQV